MTAAASRPLVLGAVVERQQRARARDGGDELRDERIAGSVDQCRSSRKSSTASSLQRASTIRRTKVKSWRWRLRVHAARGVPGRRRRESRTARATPRGLVVAARRPAIFSRAAAAPSRSPMPVAAQQRQDGEEGDSASVRGRAPRSAEAALRRGHELGTQPTLAHPRLPLHADHLASAPAPVSAPCRGRPFPHRGRRRRRSRAVVIRRVRSGRDLSSNTCSGSVTP